MKKYFLILASCFLYLGSASAQTGWTAVSSFGSNPGNLNMYSYAPAGISAAAPLVVVMHGCTQTATMVAVQSGWNTLANRHKFYVVYPEQKSANNSSNCFNWFVNGDNNRNQGEALSIRQMVDYMKSHYTVDTSRIYVTGLSAGACMTNVMMACYPDIFKAGAVMAGAPYKAGAAALYGYTTTISPQTWGDSVRAAYPGYTGTYPKVAVFQGSSDPVVNPQNEIEIMKQWTNVHNADQTADVTVTSFNGNPYVTKNTYNDNGGNEAVETYTLQYMGHAIALDTGSCYQQCGQTGTYALEVYFSSTFWAAYFFDILSTQPFAISGLSSVSSNQSGVTYSVTASSNTTYTWTVPSGATIISGQGTNQITVNFGTQSGAITLEETQNSTCKVGPVNKFVTVGASTEVSLINYKAVRIYPNPAHEYISVQGENLGTQNYVVSDNIGRIVLEGIIEEKIPISLITSGFYTIKLYRNGQLCSGASFIKN